MDEDTIIFFTIYKNASDVPGPYAIRKWDINGTSPTSTLVASAIETIEEARKLIPPNLYNLGRLPSDDPVIMESWI